jgi:hypothetical protein
MKRFLGKRIMVNKRSIPYSGELLSVGPVNIVLRCDSDMYGIQDLKFRRDEISVVCVELGYDLNKKWYVCRGDKSFAVHRGDKGYKVTITEGAWDSPYKKKFPKYIKNILDDEIREKTSQW